MKISDDSCASVNVLSVLMTAVLCEEDIASDGPVFSRGKATDCMTFWSTVPGFASFRHEIEGEFTSFVLISTLGIGITSKDMQISMM
jgi:hypothetical protein